jgi:hypothetical protein
MGRSREECLTSYIREGVCVCVVWSRECSVHGAAAVRRGLEHNTAEWSAHPELRSSTTPQLLILHSIVAICGGVS